MHKILGLVANFQLVFMHRGEFLRNLSDGKNNLNIRRGHVVYENGGITGTSRFPTISVQTNV